MVAGNARASEGLLCGSYRFSRLIVICGARVRVGVWRGRKLDNRRNS